MMKIHKTSEDVFTKDFFKTCRVKKDELDETTVIAGPSMHAGSDALLSNDGDFAAAAPPYSLTPRLGGEPLRCCRSMHILTPFARRDTVAFRPS